MSKRVVPKKRYPYIFGQPEIDKRIDELIASSGQSEDDELIREFIVTALKLRQDSLERGDIKMMNTAMKELRYALKIFYPFSHVRKVAIFGSARTPKTHSDYLQAKKFAREIVKAGWMVITGASSGIMSAGNEGAGREHSFGVNIRLPFEQEANPIIKDDSKLINFKYFFTRKLIFIRESDATVLCPGGFGTHDEGFETLTLVQTGKTNPRPIICLDPPGSTYWKAWKHVIEKQLIKNGMVDKDDINLLHFTHDVVDAAKVIINFYRNYHSMRYIKDRLVFRIKKELVQKELELLNHHFKDLCSHGKIQQHHKPFDEEENEPHTFELKRLSFYFNRRHFARLKMMIDMINTF